MGRANGARLYGPINDTLSRETPGSEVATIPNASHLANFETLAAFDEALLGFLARQ